MFITRMRRSWPDSSLPAGPQHSTTHLSRVGRDRGRDQPTHHPIDVDPSDLHAPQTAGFSDAPPKPARRTVQATVWARRYLQQFQLIHIPSTFLRDLVVGRGSDVLTSEGAGGVQVEANVGPRRLSATGM